MLTNVAGTSYSDTNLWVWTTYYYKISAVNAGGASTYTSEVGVKTLAGMPPAPVGALMSVGFNGSSPSAGVTLSPGSSQMSVSWAAGWGCTGYSIYRSTNPSSGYTAIASLNANQVGYIDTNLASSTTYYYRVTAVNASGESAVSSGGAVTLPGPWNAGNVIDPETEYDRAWSLLSGNTSYSNGLWDGIWIW